MAVHSGNRAALAITIPALAEAQIQLNRRPLRRSNSRQFHNAAFSAGEKHNGLIFDEDEAIFTTILFRMT
jgi:hypothetical protein